MSEPTSPEGQPPKPEKKPQVPGLGHVMGVAGGLPVPTPLDEGPIPPDRPSRPTSSAGCAPRAPYSAPP